MGRASFIACLPVALALSGPAAQLEESSRAGAALAHDNAAEQISRGKAAFQRYCSVCHGADAHGVPHLGKDLVTSTFAAEKSDDELMAFIKQGRAASDPHNTTGVPMPPLAGNPSLTDEQIRQIVAYLRTIHTK